MKVIILEGPGHRGKTTTLQILYAVLVTNNAKVESFKSEENNKDFEALLAYKDKKVAIVSQGDLQYHCYDAIEKYAKKNADVLIMAHTNRRSPLEVPDPHTSKVFQKTIADGKLSKVQANANDCKSLENAI
jgi:hypothetical protein